MMLNQEQSLFKLEEARNMFSGLSQDILEFAAQGKRINDVELKIWHSLMNLGRLLLEGFVDLHGTGDLGSEIEDQGRQLHRLENLHCRRYVSVYGELSISRTIYGTRESQKHEIVPLDARLGLPESDFSYVLQDWSQTFCVENTYGKTDELLQKVLSIGLSTRTLQRMGKAMSRDVEAYRNSLPQPDSAEEGEILVLSADGKGVPMRRSTEEKESRSGARRGKGEKANKKRMACVGAVYTIDPFERTAEDVVDELHRQERDKDRPAPRNKQMRAELSRVSDNGEEIHGKDVIFSWFEQQCRLRGGCAFSAVVCLMDGERALWNMLKHHKIDAVCILDLFHVLERLWNAAHCFHTEKSVEAEEFVTARLKSLLEGKVGRIIGGFRQMATKQNLKGAKLKQLENVIKYLENNRQYMNYDEYLTQGYPIGSGVVEGCRHLVKDRMERTGMRWNVDGAQAILDLRSIYVNNQWENYQEFRIQTDRCKLYPYNEIILDKWEQAA